MNQIDIRQNTDKQLARLAAQRELYSSAKKYFKYQIIGNVFNPVLLSLVAIFNQEFSVYAALYGICFLIIDLALIDRTIQKRKLKAAKIQELYDCEVLDIEKSPLKIADDIMVEEVLKYYDAHSKIKENIENIKNWYPLNNNNLDVPIARVICQRTNCWWDSKLRESYSTVLKIFGILAIIILFILGTLGKYQFIQIILIGSGLIPLFQFSIKQYYDNIDAINRFSVLNSYLLKLWEDIKQKNTTDSILEESSRRIQDEIYEGRIRNPLILDSFYKIFRQKDEMVLSKTIGNLINEIHIY